MKLRLSGRRLGYWGAITLAASGAIAPLVITVAVPAITARQAAALDGVGLLMLVAAFLLWEWSDRTFIRRRLTSWEQVIQQMRGTNLRLEKMQRHMADMDVKAAEIAPLRQLLNEERHNLSLVASGMVEMRGIIDAERANLGALANGVHDIRRVAERLDQDTTLLSASVHDFGEVVVALRTHLDALSSSLVLVEERTVNEQRNLGLVAAGLDAVRRSASNIDNFLARQDAFEDSLVLIADHVDRFGMPPPGKAPAT